MGRVGVLVVIYGSRGSTILDALCSSQEYSVEAYVADRNKNPFNMERAERHVHIPDLSIEKIHRFVRDHKKRIDFGVVGPEAPIINGVRDRVEGELEIPMICPTREYAIEGSKVAQRLLFQEVEPGLNPEFRVYDPKDQTSLQSVKRDVWKWLDHLNDQAVVKPDGVTAGKGVGVWGDHFNTREELFQHFLSNYRHGPVIIEEKLLGEESSFQAFCDGKRLTPLPETRDYKRAFEGDRGPNTGGMGSYKGIEDWLPYMTTREYQKEIRLMNRVFRRLKGRGSNPGLRGIPFYTAFIHTSSGPKILENNSRPGDPEMINLLPILRDDFVELCYKMIEGRLTRVDFKRQSTVAIYKVPPTYGRKKAVYRGNRQVDLREAYRLSEEYEGRLRIYPGSVEYRDEKTFALTSRTVVALGIGDDISEARSVSLKGLRKVRGASLWYRADIASPEHVERSKRHAESLRTG